MKKAKSQMDTKKEKVIEAEVVGKEEKSFLPVKGILAVAPDRPIDQRIYMINRYHNAAMTCLAQGAAYALLCGFELHAARAQIGHGGWIKWVEAHCKFHRSSAWRYMEAAERKAPEIANVARVQHLRLLDRAAEGMSDEERQQVIDVVTDKYADKTARQLWFELGALKTQLPKKNLPMKTPKDLPPGVTQAEYDKARQACRVKEWSDLFTQGRRLFCANDTFQDVPRDLVNTMYFELQTWARVLKVYFDKTDPARTGRL
jgi:hypothetical protein